MMHVVLVARIDDGMMGVQPFRFMSPVQIDTIHVEKHGIDED